MANAAEIDLASVTKRYGTATAVDSISLKIPAGTYCCLLGPSGCGKTSTLRMIAGHESVSDGDIVLGKTPVTNLPPAKRGTAMMFQSYALFPHLDLVDNVAFSLRMKGIDKEERRAKALEMLKLMQMEAYATRRPAQPRWRRFACQRSLTRKNHANSAREHGRRKPSRICAEFPSARGTKPEDPKSHAQHVTQMPRGAILSKETNRGPQSTRRRDATTEKPDPRAPQAGR